MLTTVVNRKIMPQPELNVRTGYGKVRCCGGFFGGSGRRLAKTAAADRGRKDRSGRILEELKAPFARTGLRGPGPKAWLS